MSAVAIENGVLRMSVNPDVGGAIAEIEHMPTGLSVLGRTPWQTVDAPIAGGAARDEAEWLTRYRGGWPPLFPNGGDACTFEGVFHGFHGEASVVPWTCDAGARTIRLTRRFQSVPVEMTRTMSVEGDEVVVQERVRMLGRSPIEVMWGHHPTFGSDLLAGPVEIACGATVVSADESYDPVANPLVAGASGSLAAMPGKRGVVDLGHPEAPLAALVYLAGFETAWAAIRRLDNAIAVTLSWDARRFPCAWAWFELNGTQDAPWLGRTALIGIEPSTTMPARGLARAKVAGGSLLRLEPKSVHETVLRLRVFRPAGPFPDAGR